MSKLYMIHDARDGEPFGVEDAENEAEAVRQWFGHLNTIPGQENARYEFDGDPSNGAEITARVTHEDSPGRNEEVPVNVIAFDDAAEPQKVYCFINGMVPDEADPLPA